MQTTLEPTDSPNVNRFWDVGWMMWDEDEIVLSSNMMLGNEGDRLRLFMSYSCKGLHNDDGGIHHRWDQIVEGGLQVTTGSTQLLWSGPSYKYKGKKCGGSSDQWGNHWYMLGEMVRGAEIISNYVRCIPEQIRRTVAIGVRA